MPGDSDTRITRIDRLVAPENLFSRYPVSPSAARFISESRDTVNNIIHGIDGRLLLIVGPCSIHDAAAAVDYASRLRKLAAEVEDCFFVIMRTYFEKARTLLGWKGLIIDPDMDGSYDINKGLEIARSLVVRITSMGVPVGGEMLDTVIPRYVGDLMSWVSIGARTVESQTHRTMASGLDMAVGFKNATNGDLHPAVNAIRTASRPAAFIGIDNSGVESILRTAGNNCCHLILRGSDTTENYSEYHVHEAVTLLEKAGVEPSVVIDCSHGNSHKDPGRQKFVMRSVLDQIALGQKAIRGVMLESFIYGGNQDISIGSDMKYGVSVTDPCLSWEETEKLIEDAAALIRRNRAAKEW